MVDSKDVNDLLLFPTFKESHWINNICTHETTKEYNYQNMQYRLLRFCRSLEKDHEVFNSLKNVSLLFIYFGMVWRITASLSLYI